jgi:hypothetical protein
MDKNSQREPLTLPASMRTQLFTFRSRLWSIKIMEAIAGALFGVVVSYLVVFALDRVIDTPPVARWAIFAAAVVTCTFAGVLLHRWVWGHRRMDQLARLVARRHPNLGDRMLGVIELVRSETEQARSRALCEAAIKQVAGEVSHRDLSDAVPRPRHRQWAWMAGAVAVVALVLGAMVPEAAGNAWKRFLSPWSNAPRYTFAAFKPLPERMVVAHGEPTTVELNLNPDSRWKPTRGSLQVGSQTPIDASRDENHYAFTVPGQIEPGWMKVSVGDATQRVLVEPMLRPELAAVAAEVRLPEYLERPQPLKKDIRGGALSVVKGSVATLTATANCELASAKVDGSDAAVAKDTVTTNPISVEESRKLVLAWSDANGLSGREPFAVSIVAREDEAPVLACEGLTREKIVIDIETITFKVHAQDDFGVRRVGIEWRSAAAEGQADAPSKTEGEQLLAAGAGDKDSIDLSGTFCAKTLGIEPQTLEVRLFVEDYMPGRPRVYSAPFIMHVLSAEQHAIWLAEQLSKWHRLALEVRDREMQLHAVNEELRTLDDAELDLPDTRRRIEQQASAERANGRRLNGLVTAGEELLRQGMRNPDFGVGHLEKWAEMLVILKDIAGNRMPSVADLLKQAALANSASPGPNSSSNPQAGQVKASGGPSGPPGDSKAKPKPPVPSLVDMESSQQPANPNQGDQGKQTPSAPKSPRLTLPVTTVMGSGGKKGGASPAAAKVDEAVKVQADLLAEFEKISDELNKILANLEGSTLVKRLKAASRLQLTIAGNLSKQVNDAFGKGEVKEVTTNVPTKESVDQHERGRAGKRIPGADAVAVINSASEAEAKASLNLSNIMDDMQGYFERRKMQRFKVVLDEMRAEDPIGGLRRLGDEIRKEIGLSAAQAEFWSDTFDRWAENLVDPACSGQCPGCKSKASLPPSIVLEAMRILEAEINLREETRVANQARPGLESNVFRDRATLLSVNQQELAVRVNKLNDRIRQLPDGEEEFAKEIALLTKVEEVMHDAKQILGRPQTDSVAIAAETEAIELLLSSKRINPKGRGGGGANPGGGGGGNTIDSALSLIGLGANENEVREDHGIAQTTGETANSIPEEFRAGLSEYFSRLEREGSKP